MFDVIICNGKIVDGTGSPWFYGDIGIKGDQITAVGNLKRESTKELINAEGKVVAPGFIDIHSHSDDKFVIDSQADSKLRQGVTTEVMGQCGNSIAPIQGGCRNIIIDELQKENIQVKWKSFEEYLEFLQDKGLPVNLVGMVGHGTLRKQVMGYENRQPSQDELDEMKRILKLALEDGAFGMTTGLIYPPGSYAQEDELIELLQEVSHFNGIYMTHMRNEGSSLVRSVQDTIQVGKHARVKVQISHHKAVGRYNWGKISETLQLVTEARQQGLDIAMDQYPYTATSTGLVSLLPEWVLEGGREQCLKRLTQDSERKKLKEYLSEEFAKDRKWSDILIARVKTQANKSLEGKTVAELAQNRGVEPEEFVLDLLLEEELDCQKISFSMDEEDVKYVMSNDLVMIGSDGSSLANIGPLSEGRPHPRNFGTFPRVLSRYVRDTGILSLEKAVWKMTGLPASRLPLFRRGLLRPGFFADIVIFDLAKIQDKASFEQPRQYPEGIEKVFVNGYQALNKNGHNGLLAGKVLKNLDN